MSDVVKEGFLVKSPPKGRNKFGGFKHWRERYFVLTPSRLSYYEDLKAYKRGDKPRGQIEAKDCVDVAMRSNPSGKREFLIVLRTSDEGPHNGREFVFCAKNQIYQGEWLKAIKSCAGKQPEETSDDEAIVVEEQPVYLSSAITPLQESIAMAKGRSSSLAEAHQRGGLSSVAREGVFAKTTTDVEEDAEFDEVFEMPSAEMMQEKGFYRKRDSQRSSGYVSNERDSVCSGCSGISSDVYIRIDRGGSDRFEISTKFEGPRYTANMTIYKAKSMGCLVEGKECRRRLSLQEHLNIIQSRSNAEHELNRPRASTEHTYENIPFSAEGRVGRQPSRYHQQGTEHSSVPTRPRPLSEHLPIRSHSEKHKESCRRSASCGATCSNIVKNDRNNGRFKMSKTAGSVNSRVGSNYRETERPVSLVNRPPYLTRRQCSKIDEKTEEGLQQRSNSDPTSSRQKRSKAVDLVYV